jgi:hypothetical protein
MSVEQPESGKQEKIEHEQPAQNIESPSAEMPSSGDIEIITARDDIQKFVAGLFEKQQLESLSEEQLAEMVIDHVNDTLLGSLSDKFENPDKPESFLAYHNTDHTLGVKDRSQRILDALKRSGYPISSKFEKLTEYTSVVHDYDHIFDKGTVPGTDEQKRIRVAGAGELVTSYEAIDRLQIINDALQKFGARPLFDSQDIQNVADGVFVTIPGFEDGTVTQPNLTKESSLMARIIALADLGEALMDGPEASLESGKRVTIEENSDIEEAIANENVKPLSDEQKEKYRMRILNGLRFQKPFVEGRKNRIDQELSGIEDEKARLTVTQLFNRYDETINGVAEAISQAEKMNFDQLVDFVGFRKFLERKRQKSV